DPVDLDRAPGPGGTGPRRGPDREAAYAGAHQPRDLLGRESAAGGDQGRHPLIARGAGDQLLGAVLESPRGAGRDHRVEPATAETRAGSGDQCPSSGSALSSSRSAPPRAAASASRGWSTTTASWEPSPEGWAGRGPGPTSGSSTWSGVTMDIVTSPDVVMRA